MRWYLGPLLRGRWPDDAWLHLGADVPQVDPGDLAAIATPMDDLGINCCTRGAVSAGGAWNAHSSGLPLTDMGWELVPKGLTELLLRRHHDCTLPPVYVMENGAAFHEQWVDGQVLDAERRDCIARHIAATGHARAAGVPPAGCMVWRPMDHVEWVSGYAKRLGIVHADDATLERTPKRSHR